MVLLAGRLAVAVGGRGVLDARNHQGKFGEDYVRALASAAGLLVCCYDLDVDGIDLGLRIPGRVGNSMSPGIDVQVKSWSRSRASAGEWHFDGLNEAQFNKLAGPDFTYPRFLFVVCVPTNPHEYATIQTDGMLLRQLGYYRSLANEVPISQPNRARRRPVRVPLSNVLTARTLRGLIHPEAADLGRAG